MKRGYRALLMALLVNPAPVFTGAGVVTYGATGIQSCQR